MSIFYTIYDEEINNERTNYGLFDLFGDIGGLMEILTLIGAQLILAYSDHNFIIKALSKLYKARTKSKGLFLNPKKNKYKIEAPQSEASPQEMASRNKYIKISIWDNWKLLLIRFWCKCKSEVSKKNDKLYKLYVEG